MELLFIGALVAFAFIIVMIKIGLSNFLRFHWQSDVLISGILAFLFVGTMAGMVIGLIAGLIVSIFLSLAKAVR